jgi:hypothetical protein
VGELGGVEARWVLGAFVAFAATIGAVGGVLAWRLAGRVGRRLGGRP